MSTTEQITTQVVEPANPQAGSGDQTSTTNQPEVRVGINRARFGVPSVVLAAMAIIALVLLLFLVWKLLSVLILVFVSILFATAIEPLVTLLRRGPFNRTTGILVVYTTIFLVIGIIAFLTIPIFLNQLGALGESLPTTLRNFEANANSISSPFVRQQAVSWVKAAEGLVDQFKTPTPASTNPQAATQAATQTALSLAEVFFSFITFFVVAFYWLTERAMIKRSVTSWFTSRRANRIRRVWDEIEVKVGGWVRGQLTLMLLIGVASVVGYFLIGVQFWPALALFIGLCEAIPLVGPYLGTAPAILIALTQSGNDGLPGLLGMGDFGPVTRALLVVVFAVILQTIEGNVLVPRIMRNSVGISPLTVIISLLVGASLGGLLGALLAVPIAGSLQVIFHDIRTAHDQDSSDTTLEGMTPASTEDVQVVVQPPKEAGATATGGAA